MEKPSISLNKYISSKGLCSRREADKWIDAGRVRINGTVARKGNRVFENDEVSIDGKSLGVNQPKSVYLMLNKPQGITCTTDKRDPDNIIDYLNYPKRIFPIGRLDKGSTGLILLTNDGDIVNKILRVEHGHEKEYVVRVDKPITAKFLREMSAGVPILGTVTKRCTVRRINSHTFSIILTQGLNRQIRRMCEYFDYRVAALKRVRIMHLTLGDLKPGKWRNLNAVELERLKQACDI